YPPFCQLHRPSLSRAISIRLRLCSAARDTTRIFCSSVQLARYNRHMKAKLVVAVVATLIVLGLLVYKRSQVANPIQPAGQTSSLSTKRALAPRLPTPLLSVSSQPPVDSLEETVSHTN